MPESGTFPSHWHILLCSVGEGSGDLFAQFLNRLLIRLYARGVRHLHAFACDFKHHNGGVLLLVGYLRVFLLHGKDTLIDISGGVAIALLFVSAVHDHRQLNVVNSYPYVLLHILFRSMWVGDGIFSGLSVSHRLR